MRIFLTGATGFIGTAVAAQLIASGYQVSGLTRSQKGAEVLAAAGVEPFLGDINDLRCLRRGASLSDGVIHTAFNHDFSTFVAQCEKDRLVVEALGEALAGTQRPLIVTSAVALGSAGPGSLAVENHVNVEHRNPRKATERGAMAVLEKGINVAVIRLSQVHNPLKQGLVTSLIETARQKGVSAWVGEGQNRWSAVHISDAARLYVLALEKNLAGRRYHAVAEEGIPLRSIAETIGQVLDVPVVRIEASEASAHFGALSKFVAEDMSASAAITRRELDWKPQGPGLLADLEQVRLR